MKAASGMRPTRRVARVRMNPSSEGDSARPAATLRVIAS